MQFRSAGFSLISVIMASGAIAGLSLVLASLNKQQGVIQRKVRTHFQVQNVSNAILRLLFDSRACTESLDLGSFITNGRPISSIKNSSGKDIFSIGKKYGNNSILIETITLDNVNASNQSGSSANLKITFKKVGQAVKGYDKVVKDFPLALDLDSSSKLVSCYSNHQFIMSTVTSNSCNQVDGAFDPQTGKCIPSALRIASKNFCEKIGAIHTNPKCDLENIKANAIETMCAHLGGTYQQGARECTLPSP